MACKCFDLNPTLLDVVPCFRKHTSILYCCNDQFPRISRDSMLSGCIAECPDELTRSTHGNGEDDLRL